jgi:hypothetical protein
MTKNDQTEPIQAQRTEGFSEGSGYADHRLKGAIAAFDAWFHDVAPRRDESNRKPESPREFRLLSSVGTCRPARARRVPDTKERIHPHNSGSGLPAVAVVNLTQATTNCCQLADGGHYQLFFEPPHVRRPILILVTPRSTL